MPSLFAVLAAACLALSACVGAAPAPQPISPRETEEALVLRGRAIADVFCVSCHAVGPVGESPNPDAPAFRTFSERYPIAALEEAFAEGILVGHPAMPEFAFAPEDVEALVAYLQTIQTRRGG